jgi:hypothetical protein
MYATVSTLKNPAKIYLCVSNNYENTARIYGHKIKKRFPIMEKICFISGYESDLEIYFRFNAVFRTFLTALSLITTSFELRRNGNWANVKRSIIL